VKTRGRFREAASTCFAAGVVWVVLGVIAVAYVLRPRDEEWLES
jgi:hypothetical protein